MRVISQPKKKALFVCVTPHSLPAGARAYHRRWLHYRLESHVRQRIKAEPTPFLVILKRNTRVGCGGYDVVRSPEMLVSKAEVHVWAQLSLIEPPRQRA